VSRIDKEQMLRNIPSVNEILNKPQLLGVQEKGVPRFVMLRAIQDVLDMTRRNIIQGKEEPESDWLDHLLEQVMGRIADLQQHRLQKVINGTGVVLHTNMGRALLPKKAVEAVAEAAAAFTNLELDLASGKRGQRYRHVEELLCQLTGAENALVVNNNAAAVLLALNTLGRGQEAIVSRGQLVEIGGSFRVPEVMAQSGVAMIEVGTTNKTKLKDYEDAISENTGLLVRVHTSNYRIIGFTQEVALREMVALGRARGIPVLDDLGSGCLMNLNRWELPIEPTVMDSVQAGADIITFSADKLMGGPQAGIILGRKKFMDRMKKNPLLRALRLDKLTLAALESILYIYLENKDVEESIPVLRMLSEKAETIREKAVCLTEELNLHWGAFGLASVVATASQAGGGSLPETEIPSYGVAMTVNGWSASQLEAYLRTHEPPIIARISQDQVVMDLRTLLPGDDKIILTALAPERMIGGSS
jgi:L-seryl-tRNA(Ser) seleniumtransferase